MSGVLLGFLLRRHRLSVGLSLLVPIALGVVIGLLYPTYADARKLLEVFKLSTRFFGGEDMDLFSPSGSFSLPFQHPLCLLDLALIAGIATLALPAGERGRGGLDLLVATPLSRTRLMATVTVFSALAALLIGISGEIGAMLGATIADAADAVSPGRYALVALVSAALCFCLSGIALLVSAASRDRGQASLIYGVVVFVIFVTDVVARLWTKGAWLGWYTPYGYLRPSRVLGEGGVALGLRDAGALTAAALVLHATAALVAARRARA